MTDKTTDAAPPPFGERYYIPDPSELEQVLRSSPTPDPVVSIAKSVCVALVGMLVIVAVVLGLEHWHETRIQIAELRTIEAVGAPADLEDYFQRHYGIPLGGQ